MVSYKDFVGPPFGPPSFSAAPTGRCTLIFCTPISRNLILNLRPGSATLHPLHWQFREVNGTGFNFLLFFRYLYFLFSPTKATDPPSILSFCAHPACEGVATFLKLGNQHMTVVDNDAKMTTIQSFTRYRKNSGDLVPKVSLQWLTKQLWGSRPSLTTAQQIVRFWFLTFWTGPSRKPSQERNSRAVLVPGFADNYSEASRRVVKCCFLCTCAQKCLSVFRPTSAELNKCFLHT